MSADRTIALAIDSTLAVVAGNLGRAAITGDVAIAAGSNASAIGANKVTNAMIRAGAAASVIGVAGVAGNVADIASSADGQVLLRAAGSLSFSSAIPQASVSSLVADLAAKVPTTRTISTTAPLAGGGDLSADRTLTVATFGDAQAGVVPASGGGTSNFLRADGTWSAPAPARG